MAAIGPIDNPRSQNHKFEAIALLVFPEQLFLPQFGVGVMITPLGVGFEQCLFIHPFSSAEASHSIYAE